MLHGVRDLVRRDRNGRDRASAVVLRQQPDRARSRIVVIAFVGLFDRHGLQTRLVEEVARKLGAGAGKIRPLTAMLRQHAADPELRSEDDREDEKCASSQKDRHPVSPRSFRSGHR